MALLTETAEFPGGTGAWTCVFCTDANEPQAVYCHRCGLSRRSGRLAQLDDGPRRVPAFLRATQSPAVEGAIALGLLALWKLGDVVSGARTTSAVRHGRAVWHLERVLDLPSEASVQAVVLPHALTLRLSDLYYAGAHLGGMVLFAGWLYARHRSAYARWRNRVLCLTAVAFVLQLYAVAPPRLVPGIGVHDTARELGQSVYAHGRLVNQVSSLPSVHVLWAILVAAGVLVSSRSRFRWLVLGHPVLTTAVVVVTGNHYWLDAVAAGALALAAAVPRLPAVSHRLAAGSTSRGTRATTL